MVLAEVMGRVYNLSMSSRTTAARQSRLDAIVPQYPMSAEHAAWIAQGCPWNRGAARKGWVQIETERNAR